MRYHYSHRAMMARHKIEPCGHCNGEGWIETGRFWVAQPEECSRCDGRGTYTDEAIGLTWKRIRTHRMEIAA